MSGSAGVQRGRVCPSCGKEDSVPLVRGLPGGDLWSLAERGLVELGGCMVGPDDPVLACRACGLHWGHDGDPTADEAELAAALGVEWPDVVRALGSGWRQESVYGEPEHVRWFVSGEPAQLAVRVDGPRFLLAPPLTDRGTRRGAGEQELHRDDLIFVPEVVADAAEAIASRRRRSFRWCRSCRRVQEPESYVGAARMWEPCAWAAGLHPDDQ